MTQIPWVVDSTKTVQFDNLVDLGGIYNDKEW